MQNLNLIIRSTLFALGQVIATILIASLGLLCFAFPYSVRYRIITQWSHFIIWWAKVVCGIHYKVFGKENLPNNNAIVLCKHQSAWETLFLQTLLPPQTWVLKKQLLTIPFFGWALALLEPIAIDRKKASAIKQLLSQGKKQLQQGRWVIIFPEGTRTAIGQKGKYARSGPLLAMETGFPVVLMSHNAGIFWPRHSFIKNPGTISFVIGPTLDPKQLTLSEIQEKSQEWIEATAAELSQSKT